MPTVDHQAAIIEAGLAPASPLWRPHPDNAPQQLAYEMAGQVMELGYGGQAGGGKTDLALGLAASRFQRSLIFRRQFSQCRELIERGDEIFPAPYVAGAKREWSFGERRVRLGSLPHARDWTKYKGGGNDLIVFDEAAEFPEKPVRSITGWNRTSDKTQHTLVLYCFNPPTNAEGEWIIQYFKPWLDPQHPTPARPGEIRWFASVMRDGQQVQIEVDDGAPFDDKGQTVYPISRTFVPASRHDNPYLGEDYERRLHNLPEPLRTMVLEGDFTLSTDDDPWQVLPTAWVLAAQARWHDGPPAVAMRSLGADIARGGDDKTVLVPLHGTWFGAPIIARDTQTHDGQTAADFIAAHHQGQAKIMVDVVGYGASAYDHLKVRPGLRGLVVPVNNGASYKGVDKSGQYAFANVRAASYWYLREALNPASGEAIALPPGRQVRVELCAARWRETGGKIKIEPKDDVKARLGHSPDLADAIVLAWWVKWGGASITQYHSF